MKLRQQASDFQVQELNQLPIGHQGNFAVYELTKSGWNTLDVVQSIATQWKCSRRDISHAGLKDRHAATTQILTIRNGLQRNLRHQNFKLEYLGQADRATTAHDIAANRFTLVLRSLSPAEVESAEAALPVIAETGIANYFDDQRFGSYLAGHPFIAEAWIREDYEQALWLTFAEPHANDDAHEREQKQLLRDHWNDWETCKSSLERSHRRSIVTFLDDRNGDYKGAWACVNSAERGLFLTAFQSHLWNMMLSALLRESLDPADLIPMTLKTGDVVFPSSINSAQADDLFATTLPLPSARVDLADHPHRELIEATLHKEGWAISDLKVRHPRDRFFPRAERNAIVPVQGLDAQFGIDELASNLSKLTISFELPRGSYATMVVKRLMVSGA